MTQRKPVAGPYLYPADSYPFTMAIFRKSDFALAWAVSVLKPEHGLLRALEIPPVAQWIGAEVDAVVVAPDKWPQEWTATLG